MFNVFINDNAYSADDDQTILDVARRHKLAIPTLCYHPALKPSGTCKLCAVEVVSASDRPTTMLACILKARADMRIITESERVQQARSKAFRRLLQMAPQSESIQALAAAHGVHLGPPPDGCIRCRLCIRVCSEVVGPAALFMDKREDGKYVAPKEGRCIGCGTCANLCPTGVISVIDDANVRTIRIRDEVIGRHPLERCEGCGKRFATQKFLSHIQERTLAHHTDVKTHHRYCPTCAKLFSDRLEAVRAKIPGDSLPPADG